MIDIRNLKKGGGRLVRVCVCTSYSAEAEPRAPRHAASLASSGLPVEVIFVDCAPIGMTRRPPKVFDGLTNFTWRTHYFPSRTTRPFRMALNRVSQKLRQLRFSTFGSTHAVALSSNVAGLQGLLQSLRANIYFGHNIDTLSIVVRAATRLGALALFDSMEYHSDMGDSQPALEKRIVGATEKEYLGQCAVVFASSDQMADALAQEYGIKQPIRLYNVPPLEPVLPSKTAGRFDLYWRNSTIGLGERGLDEALTALSRLPGDIALHLQGNLPSDPRGGAVRSRIVELGVEARVFIHPPCSPEDAVKEASRYTIGLCLERKCSRNHDLTVSNKIFDYHMGGLVTIASDLPGLSAVIQRSQGGLMFRPGQADDLVEKILLLYRDRKLVKQYADNARYFALNEGNREEEMKRFIEAFSKLLPKL